VHRASGLNIPRQRHATEYVTNRAKVLFLWLVQERRHLCDVSRNQQEALAALSQAAQLPAVVSCLSYGIAVMTEQAVYLVQQMPAASGQARDVLEDNQRYRIILPSFTHQPNTAQSQFVKGLILGRFAGGLGQQPTGALAWRTDEYGVGAQILRGAAYVLGSRLGPASRRLLAMETGVLLAGKEV